MAKVSYSTDSEKIHHMLLADRRLKVLKIVEATIRLSGFDFERSLENERAIHEMGATFT